MSEAASARDCPANRFCQEEDFRRTFDGVGSGKSGAAREDSRDGVHMGGAVRVSDSGEGASGVIGGSASVAAVAGMSICMSWPAIARMTPALSPAGGACNVRAWGSSAAVA